MSLEIFLATKWYETAPTATALFLCITSVRIGPVVKIGPLRPIISPKFQRVSVRFYLERGDSSFDIKSSFL